MDIMRIGTQHMSSHCLAAILKTVLKLSHQNRSTLNVHFLDAYAFILGNFHYLL